MRGTTGRMVGRETLRCTLLLACVAGGPPALAGEFMFMPTAAIVRESGSADHSSRYTHELIADLFYSGDHGRLRLLSELQIERNGWDMERLQAGWRINPEVSLWFGRYHNPIGY